MKASELRIGNFIEYWIGEDGINWTLNTVDVEDLKWCDLYESDFNKHHRPIPITEEWLERFGFGKSDDHERGHNTHKHFGFYYDWHFKRFKLEVDDGANVVDVPMEIQYVHQLQNLYYSLTSEELTLKGK